jgi:hypothetical protein
MRLIILALAAFFSLSTIAHALHLPVGGIVKDRVTYGWVRMCPGSEYNRYTFIRLKKTSKFVRLYVNCQDGVHDIFSFRERYHRDQEMTLTLQHFY